MIIYIILGIVIILTIVCVFIGNYFYNLAINSKRPKAFVLNQNAEPGDEENDNENKKYIEWLTSNSSDVYTTSYDNLKLHAYEVKNEKSQDWMIIIHGFSTNGTAMSEFAYNFYNRSFSVLVVDLRSSGKSEGNYIGMGWHDRLDIVKWINYISDKYPNSKIGLFGISMGAATVMMTTGENLPNNVKFAIEDCGYTSAWDEFKYQLKKIFKINSFLVLNIASIAIKIRAKYSIKEASSIKQLAKSKTPTLFIHGDSDEFVPSYMINENFNSAVCDKEKLIIPSAGHTKASRIDPEKYWNMVDKFIEKYNI